MVKVLFIAPTSKKLDLSADLAAVGNGNEIEEVANGLIDRGAVERLLRNSTADVLYLATDGTQGVLELSGGDVIDENDLVMMMSGMRRLGLVVINACNSLGIASAIHNRYHIPVASAEAPVSDPAAIQFARSFFSGLRNGESIGDAFASARATVTRLYGANGLTLRLINGDDATKRDLNECMTFVKSEIGEMRLQLSAIEADVKELKTQPNKAVILILILLGIAAAGQWAQPWLAAAVAR